MARSGEIEINWADGVHSFRLAIGQLFELEDKTGCGPLELLRRVTTGNWRLRDVRETLRLGLIGGGMKPPEALKLIQRYVDDRPLAESVPVAQAVLMVILYGRADEDQPGETERRGSQSGRTVGSPSPPSTAQVQ